ncbi:prenyltransferase/squalene oxidase repeat-containing protein [Streptomyces sp. NPDC052101]|uniref:terpene synthase family protein n=1 Tax=Streptomyces sp. NPDC052101 TaxID=3155763 RepID=UPI003414AD90
MRSVVAASPLVRVSPHLAAARGHTKDWARGMGMLESGGVWSEASFDAADYALLAAACYPDAAADRLPLVADWYVWLFYLDDHFDEAYMRRGDVVGARAFLRRLSAVLAGGHASVLASDDPAERALADLWSRTAPLGAAGDWRRRFRESNQGVLDEHERELVFYGRRQAPDPISYLDMRRQGRGGPWAAELVELALAAQLPVVICGSGPVRALEDAFGDVVRLDNDLSSYRREVEEGEVNNQVLAVQRFLGCGPEQAQTVVRDLLDARMHRFEEIVATELPVLFVDQALGPSAQAGVLRYVQGLRDFIAGSQWWNGHSGRNAPPERADSHSQLTVLGGPDGRGTSHVRSQLERSAEQLGECSGGAAAGPSADASTVTTVVDDARRTVGLATAAHRALTWARGVGMTDPLFAVWEERDLSGLDLTVLSPLLSPAREQRHLGAQEVELLAAWYVWSRFADDFFSTRYLHSRDVVGATAFLSRLPQFMPPDGTGPDLKPANPMERGLAELWSRSRSVTADEWHHGVHTSLLALAGDLRGQLTDMVDSRAALGAESTEALHRAWSTSLLGRLSGLCTSPRLQQLRAGLSGTPQTATDDIGDLPIRERTARLAARVAQSFDDRGAFREACDSRVTESTMMLALLRREDRLPAVRHALERFLAERRRDPLLNPVERHLADISLGTTEGRDGAEELLGDFDHFTAGRKQLALRTYLAVLGAAPYPDVDVTAIDYHGHATWVELALCAMKILNAHGQGRPDLARDEDREFLLARLGEGRRDIWEANISAHLMALLAVHEFAPGSQPVRDGIAAILAARNPDGGLPFIPDYTVFFGALAGLALATVDAEPLLLHRIGDYLAEQQADNGSWPFTERVRETDVEGAGAVIEVLRAVDPHRYQAPLARAADYLLAMANSDGGFPTYRQGHSSEVVMTANTVNALAPEWDRHGRVLESAVAFLLDAQKPDGTYERSWSLSEAHAIRRVLHALHRVPEQARPCFADGIAQAYARAGAYLERTQNADGGWGQRPGDDSDPISTAHTLSAAAVLGTPNWSGGGLHYLLRQQRPDGGFTSIPDQVAPRPIPYNFPGMADLYVLTALGDLRRLGRLPDRAPAAPRLTPAARPAPTAWGTDGDFGGIGMSALRPLRLTGGGRTPALRA